MILCQSHIRRICFQFDKHHTYVGDTLATSQARHSTSTSLQNTLQQRVRGKRRAWLATHWLVTACVFDLRGLIPVICSLSDELFLRSFPPASVSPENSIQWLLDSFADMWSAWLPNASLHTVRK